MSAFTWFLPFPSPDSMSDVLSVHHPPWNPPHLLLLTITFPPYLSLLQYANQCLCTRTVPLSNRLWWPPKYWLMTLRVKIVMKFSKRVHLICLMAGSYEISLIFGPHSCLYNLYGFDWCDVCQSILYTIRLISPFVLMRNFLPWKCPDADVLIRGVKEVGPHQKIKALMNFTAPIVTKQMCEHPHSSSFYVSFVSMHMHMW